jgi:hypothetical protein
MKDRQEASLRKLRKFACQCGAFAGLTSGSNLNAVVAIAFLKKLI